MDDYALILNAGSSSLKFCVFDVHSQKDGNWKREAKLRASEHRLDFLQKGLTGGILAENDLSADVRDGRSAIDTLASWLRSKYGRARVLGVGHRVVHGGTLYARPTIVTRKVLADLYELVPLAPLHQPHNLAAIQAVFERMPDVPQVACFDTGFHQDIHRSRA